MSIFKDFINRQAEGAIDLNPFVQTGFVLQNDSVIDQVINDPRYQTLNAMSGLEISQLKQDSNKTGWAVGLKDASGVSRKDRIFCNPKFTDFSKVGSLSGQEYIGDPSKGFIQADVVFSGANNQAPTVVGTQYIPRSISNNVTVTDKDIMSNMTGSIGDPSNVPLAGALSKVPVIGGAIGPDEPQEVEPFRFDFKIENGQAQITPKDSVPPLLDKMGKPIKKADNTGRGIYGNSLRTGTLKISNTELAHLASMSVASTYGII